MGGAYEGHVAPAEWTRPITELLAAVQSAEMSNFRYAHTRPIVVDVAWFVCLSVCLVSPTNTAEPIEMP